MSPLSHTQSSKEVTKGGKSSNLPTPSVPTKNALTPHCRPISSLHKLTPTDTNTVIRSEQDLQSMDFSQLIMLTQSAKQVSQNINRASEESHYSVSLFWSLYSHSLYCALYLSAMSVHSQQSLVVMKPFWANCYKHFTEMMLP